jgi:signal transduction histidine kinase
MEEPILINTIPAFLDFLAEAVSPDYPRVTANSYNIIVDEHGGERARLTDYTHQELIKEYLLLRLVIVSKLGELGVKCTSEEMAIIHVSIDEAIQRASSNFALALSEMRERFIATLSHDMKNPISVIMMSMGLLKRRVNDPFVQSHIQKTSFALRKLNRMIDNLLDQTLLKSGGKISLKVTSSEIQLLVSEILNDLSEDQKNRFRIDGEIISGYWDADQLSRAIENLVSNALKYSSPDSDIAITTQSVHGRMIFSIHNEGPPIPEDERESIFQVFRRSHSARFGQKQGWGLGLPQVRAVAEAHGGSIGLDSSEKSGTTFTIDLPVDSRPFQEAPTVERG